MEITLYGRPFNRSDRVQWTLEELDLKYRYRKLDVFGCEHRSQEVRAKYGLARLPFVELDGEVLFESGAIMLHLAETFRDRVDLIPTPGVAGRAGVLQWLFFGLSTLEAADPESAPGGEPAPSASLQEVLAFLDHHLAGREFATSERFTLADIALATGLQWYDDEVDSAFPALRRYVEEMNARPCRQRLLQEPERPSRATSQ